MLGGSRLLCQPAACQRLSFARSLRAKMYDASSTSSFHICGPKTAGSPARRLTARPQGDWNVLGCLRAQSTMMQAAGTQHSRSRQAPWPPGAGILTSLCLDRLMAAEGLLPTPHF